MRKFWKWMKAQKYGRYFDGNDFPELRYVVMEWGKTKERIATHPNKAMLIGYMMEYLDNANSKYLMPHYNRIFFRLATTQERYEFLENEINDL